MTLIITGSNDAVTTSPLRETLLGFAAAISGGEVTVELTAAVDAYLMTIGVDTVELRIPADDTKPLADAARPAEVRDAISVDDCVYLPSQDAAAVMVVGFIFMRREELGAPLVEILAQKRAQFLSSIKYHADQPEFARRVAGAFIALDRTAACVDCRARLRVGPDDPRPAEAALICPDCAEQAFGSAQYVGTVGRLDAAEPYRDGRRLAVVRKF